MKPTESEPLAAIDKWFAGRCDGLWEHQSGLALTTTDNPGWLVTVDDTVDESVFNDLSNDIRKRWGAECVREPDKTKVYAASLKDCVCATAHILAARKSTPPKQ